ncbi:nephrocystin-4 [Heptranchias perlo]|uniref:nephrocystin-4 n=1 Tax=Heptranchias perlo TaxID=212740 RepID=UPI00355A58ED
MLHKQSDGTVTVEGVKRRGGSTELGVISEHLEAASMFADNVTERQHIDEEKAKDGILRRESIAGDALGSDRFLVSCRLHLSYQVEQMPCAPSQEEKFYSLESTLEYGMVVPLDSLLEGVVDVQCQLRLTLFDTTYSHFFGRTWKSSPQPVKYAQGQPAKVLFNQAVYFHTSLNFTHIAIIVEVVAIVKKREGNEQVLSCGFGILHLSNRLKLKSDAAKGQNAKRLNLYHGTPRALLHPASQDPIEKNKLMTLIEGSCIFYTLWIHLPLEGVSHLIPENMLVSGSETIPGVAAPFSQTSDALKKSHLLKTVTCHLDKLSLQLYPTLEKFEEELVELLNADRLLKNDRVADGNTVVIQERRLHIGVHNGWCYVQKPQVVVLIPGNVTAQGRSGSFSKSLPKESLVLRSRIQLSEMVKHRMFGVIFQLEYVFSSPAGADGKDLTCHS